MATLGDVLSALNTRLTRPDLTQLMTLGFGVLLFTLLTGWPVNENEANNSWFFMVQVRLVLFALLGAAYGSTSLHEGKRQAGFTLAALLVFALLSSPFDIASYAASYPNAPIWWSLLIIPIDTVAFFGLGLVLGQLSSLLRLRALLPITVPALIIGAMALDSFLGVTFLSPLTAATRPVLLHLGFMLVLMIATFTYLFRNADKEVAV